MNPARSARERISRPLLAWYDQVRRDLPFRRTRDPYAIWVSEVMLQQTQVSTVLPYFERWMQRFPNVTALARASEDEVLHAFQGLGYYSRARALRRAAQAVVERFAGELPKSVAELLSLPGVGPYSAGAIASIAFEARVPVVDGNVIRVLCRLFGLDGDPARAPLKQELWRIADELVPESRPGDYNQALMELGALLCTPKKPDCSACPLSRTCAANAAGNQESLPRLAPRPQVTEVHMAAALVFRAGRVAVVKLSADAPRWASMWQFPAVEVERGETPAAAAARAARKVAGVAAQVESEVARVKHSVTRYRITVDAFRCLAAEHSDAAGKGIEQLVWRKPAELTAIAMPAAHRRLARVAAELTPPAKLAAATSKKPKRSHGAAKGAG
ncbi:MAG TPA: A/G-specific adenine glycosylase [Polyangiaceae bacterium]|nr:A/G-specific adenine glycosylase [Polyangiaceae bacterium]